MAGETVTGVRPRRRKSRRGRTAALACLVVVLGVGGFFAYRTLHKSAAVPIRYTTQAAQKVTIIQSVSGTGSVNLSSSASVSPETSGTVSGLGVALGDTVKKGQTLFSVVSTDLEQALITATNSYNQALKSAGDAEISLAKAQNNLDDLEYQRTHQQWGYYDYGNAQLASLKSTPPSTTTSTTARPSTTTTSQPRTTSTTVSDLDIRIAEEQVTSAELSVVVAQSNITLAKMALDQAKKDMTNKDVTAPLEGTITEINVSNGDTVSGSSSSKSSSSSSSSSSSQASSSAAMVITDLSVWNVTVTLAEADIGSVKTGQKATLAFDALPNISLTGKVSTVSPSGTNSSGVVSYSATVVPDVGDASIKGGMTVSVNIITLVAADVIGVPNAAVKAATDGSKYVQILENGKPANQTVEVGVSDSTYTEITSGLTEGQEVITRTVNPAISTSTTARGGSGGGLLNTGGGGFPTGGGFPMGGGGPPRS